MAQVVEPATILRWHRAGLRNYWRRPRIDRDLRDLTRTMSRETRCRALPGSMANCSSLGSTSPESAVCIYIIRRQHPPSAGWKMFLRNAEANAAICAEFAGAVT
jgi:hypothetical protein